jgi:hypothetical protein
MPQPANKRFVMEDKLTTDLALKANIASPTFTGIATFGSISSVNSNSAVNAASSITAGTHITATLGNITAGAGNITATGGTVTGGAGVTATTGNVVATAGDVNATAGDVNATAGAVNAFKIRATSTESAFGDDAAIITGDPTQLHIGIGSAMILARGPSGASTLSIQANGGNLNIGATTSTTTVDGSLITATGNGTISPLKIPAGTLMTTPTDDVIEADANAFYGTTNSTHGRGVMPTMLFSSGTAAFTSTTAAQNLFPVPNDTLAMAANTTYMVEGLIHIQVPAASAAAHTMSLTLNGGTAATTAQVMAFATQNNTSTTAIPTAAASYLLTGTGASTIWATASTAATAVFRTVHFKGIVRCTTAGTFIPRITTSVASVAVPSGTSNNYMTLTPIGSNTVSSVGSWS